MSAPAGSSNSTPTPGPACLSTKGDLHPNLHQGWMRSRPKMQLPRSWPNCSLLGQMLRYWLLSGIPAGCCTQPSSACQAEFGDCCAAATMPTMCPSISFHMV